MLRAVGFVCRVCTHAVNGCAFVLIVVHCYVVSLCRVVRAVDCRFSRPVVVWATAGCAVWCILSLAWGQQLAVVCGVWCVAELID